MSAKSETRRHKTLVFEVTQACNLDCLHCYNVWKNARPYPQGQMNTDDTLRCLDRLITESGVSLMSISGGEPLLRTDLFEIIDFVRTRGVTVNLLTNGTLLSSTAIERLLPNKVSVYEIPLLADKRDVYYQMTRGAKSFDKAVMAIALLKASGQTVVVTFVATLLNLPRWRQTIDLAMALGVDGIMFNRFNPGGEGFRNIDVLQAPPQMLMAALEIADQASTEYDLPISCSIPLPPCLLDTRRFTHLSFGYCALGTPSAYYTIDPAGNLRPCNHSPRILGNTSVSGFWNLIDGDRMIEYVAARMQHCGGCGFESECQGCCRAAAEACYGSPLDMDPFLQSHEAQVVKPATAWRPSS